MIFEVEFGYAEVIHDADFNYGIEILNQLTNSIEFDDVIVSKKNKPKIAKILVTRYRMKLKFGK